jgi:hypothetical protein
MRDGRNRGENDDNTIVARTIYNQSVNQSNLSRG